MKKTTMFLLIALLVAGGTLEAQASDAELGSLTKLDFHLDKIRKETETARLWGSGVLLVSGAAIGIAGTAIATSNEEYLGSGTGTAVGFSAGTGLVFAGIGLVELFWKSDFETQPEKYLALPRDSAEAVKAKVIFGESALQSLSDKARFNRYLSAGTSGAVGLGLLALYGADHSSENQGALYSGIVYLGTGIVEALLESSPESSWRDYSTWKAAK